MGEKIPSPPSGSQYTTNNGFDLWARRRESSLRSCRQRGVSVSQCTRNRDPKL